MPSNFELTQTSVEYDNLDVDVNNFPYGPVSYSAIDLLPGIPHIDQLEVERLFNTGAKTGAVVFTVTDRRRMFKLPKNWYTVDETNKTISILKFSDVTGVGGVDTTFNLTTGLGLKYISLYNANTFITIPNLSSNDTIIIRRKTLSEEKLVSFTAGSRLTSGQLNLTSNQLINIIQELLWKVDNEVIIKYDKDAIDGPFLGSAGGSFIDVSGNINMNGMRITNLGDSSLLSDAMAKSEISDVIFRHGVITKDIAPDSSPGTQNDVIEGTYNEGRSGVWFNPLDGKLRAWAGNAWVIVTNAINPAVNPFLVQTNTNQLISGEKTFSAPTTFNSIVTVPSLAVTGNITGSTVGALASSLLPSGCVLQVVFGSTQTPTTLGTSVTQTALTASITPKRANSKIIVIMSNSLYVGAPAENDQWIKLSLFRSVGGGEFNNLQDFELTSYTLETNSQHYSILTPTQSHQDTVASTAVHTYTVYGTAFKADNNTTFIARHSHASSVSSMILVEVAA